MWRYTNVFRSHALRHLVTIDARYLYSRSRAGGKLVKITSSNYVGGCNRPRKDDKINQNVYTAVDKDSSFFLKVLYLLSFYKDRKEIAMDLEPPPTMRGMKCLDREKFRKIVQIPGIRVPLRNVSIIGKYLKKAMIHIPRFKNIVELDSSNPDCNKFKIFLLDPSKYPVVDSFTDEQAIFFKEHDVDLASWKLYETELNYENWNYDDILKAVLPVDSEGVGGYSAIGHIAHLNLRDDLLEYKEIIGEVLMDKVNQVRTVVNKLNIIDNTYRNFSMEVIAGDEDFVTTTKEHGHNFKFDFSKVYWNPRLATEHQRVTNILSRGDVLYDVFAGVGPFAVPAAKKGCEVIANDLNPESFKWLGHNMTINKVKVEPQLYNLDGRQFIRTIVKPHLLSQWQKTVGVIPKLNIVMNLPAMAVDFLDVFPGLFDGIDASSLPTWVIPKVFCYCFSKSEQPEEDARKMVEAVIGRELPEGHQVRNVRNVAPNKEMLCVIFSLEQSLLFSAKSQHSIAGDEEAIQADDSRTDRPPQKKIRCDNESK